MPARSRTRRCVVTACRLRYRPSANCVIERAWPSLRRALSSSRGGSPRAAKPTAGAAAERPELGFDTGGEGYGLQIASLWVRTQCVDTPRIVRQAIEARLSYH